MNHRIEQRRLDLRKLELQAGDRPETDIAAERASRPGDFAPRIEPPAPHLRCPFCPGHEEETPPALETYGRHGEWLVRVVPNLYPAFEGKGDFTVDDVGPVVRDALVPQIERLARMSLAR